MKCYYKCRSPAPNIRSQRSAISDRLVFERNCTTEYYCRIIHLNLATNCHSNNRRRGSRKANILRPSIHMILRTIRSRPVRC